MKNTIKLLSVLFVVILVAVTSLIVQVNKHIQSNNAVKEKSDQAKAEELAEKMKPKIEEHLHKRDIHNFIKTITFEKDVTINPMGDITIDGYVNDEPEKYGFSASLQYRAKKIGSMSYDPELSDRFIDWEEYKDEPEVKENYLKSFTKEERDQYLRDIGEKE
ncbi:DUF1433 domain-containing protein [Bacillus altitudinis]|uniref:DUF1433 domain-containing protein n=3 Tax=Bacillus TaxID=1386 RepID=A0ABV1RZK1_BACAB|nr:DUF1433 domain-containing protein [Bacillus altitudinis]MCL7874433.1 DUF1433 domain-containing protein [Bacillus altitudinis]MCW4358389.1 DUF1433 domain-containing protein [Bacillus altitudinis]MCY7627951.1 DUF1433 domain-containing protein [Bacillus altitudinis]MDX2365836.1 DUF1433 domain-containing protein [Bacillus altitudinis]NOL34672.1 DUF1433 domain-containing protein [Bacillus altitudinis]